VLHVHPVGPRRKLRDGEPPAVIRSHAPRLIRLLTRRPNLDIWNTSRCRVDHHASNERTMLLRDDWQRSGKGDKADNCNSCGRVHK
jgi:hypothetical protein